jgi:hypothetical protein
MWKQIDESFSSRHGVPRGFAFDKSVNERPAMKKAQVKA